MIKLGMYGSYFGKDDPKTLPILKMWSILPTS